jgi:hypothetical protein
MRRPEIERLLGEEGRVDASVNNPSPARLSHATYFIAAQSVSRVDTDSDYIAGLNLRWIEVFQRFIANLRISVALRSRRGQHEKPAWGDDGCTDGVVAGINRMNARKCLPFQVNFAIDRDSGKVGCAPDFLTPWAGNESPAACFVVYHTHYVRN